LKTVAFSTRPPCSSPTLCKSNSGWRLASLVPPASTWGTRFGRGLTLAETKEYLGGYYELECTAEQAIEAAAKCPDARFGAIQVQEVMPVEAPAGMEMPH